MSTSLIARIPHPFRVLAWAGLCSPVGGLFASGPLPHTDPGNNGGWVLNQEISDEFEGDAIDSAKWFIQGENGEFQNNFIGRAPAQFAPRNVTIADGYLKITSRWEPDYPFSDKTNHGRTYEKITTGALVSKATFLYGYMEIRCRAASGPVSSAFWTTGKGGELDVFEHWGESRAKPESAKRYRTSFYDWRDPKSSTWGKRIWTNDHLLEFRVADDFHIYALEWDPNYLKVYVDGRLIRSVTREAIGDAWVVTNEQKVWVDSEIFPWEVDPESLTARDFPSRGHAFTIDYIRIWHRSALHSSRDAHVPQNLLSNRSFEKGSEDWSLKGGAKLLKGAHACTGEHAIRLEGKGRLERTVAVKPNTTYILSAWAKIAGTNMENTSNKAFVGVKDFGGKTLRRPFHRPTYYGTSIEFTTGPETTSATLFFTNGPRGEVAIVDDFELVESSILQRADLPVERGWPESVASNEAHLAQTAPELQRLKP